MESGSCSFSKKAVLEGLKAIDFQPDIIHAHTGKSAGTSFLQDQLKYIRSLPSRHGLHPYQFGLSGQLPRDLMYLAGGSFEELLRRSWVLGSNVYHQSGIVLPVISLLPSAKPMPRRS